MNNIPYFIEHAIVACLISLAVSLPTGNPLAGCAAGIAFYAGREIRDREKLGFWDWKGLLTPIIACLTQYLILAQ